MQKDLDQKDVQSAFKRVQIFNESHALDRIQYEQKLDTICDQLYEARSSTPPLTGAQVSYLLRTACGTHQSPDDILWGRGKALFEKRDCFAARKYFQRIILSYPNSKYRSGASAYISQCDAKEKTNTQ